MLRAAAQVFVRKGFHGATIDDVAAGAGYSPAAVYKYFADKDELYGRLWTQMAERVGAVFVESNRLAEPFAPRLQWLVTRLSLLYEQEPEPLLAFLAWRPFAARAQSPFEKRALRHYRAHLAQVEELMRVGVAEGALRGGDAADYALLLMGLLYEFAHRWASSPQFDVPVQIARLLSLFVHGAGQPAR